VNVRNIFTVWKVFFTVLTLLLLADCAQAYAGPGVPLELGSYVISLAAWVGIAFSALFLYPFYAFLGRLRQAIKSRGAAPTFAISHSPIVDNVGSCLNGNATGLRAE
jgi:hypothetical protein